MCFSAAASSENDQGSMNLASNTAPVPSTHAVQRRRHPAEHRVAHPALDVFDPCPVVALVPLPVQGFSREPELDDEIAGQVFRLGLAPFFAPEAEQSGLIAAHDNPGVRAANKVRRLMAAKLWRNYQTLRSPLLRVRFAWSSDLAVRMDLGAEFRIPSAVLMAGSAAA